MVEYILAPYFRVGFKGETLICGFGSIQKKFSDPKLQVIMLKLLEYVVIPRSLDDIKSFLFNSFPDSAAKKIAWKYLIKNNWLIESKAYNRDSRYSRNYLYYNLSGTDPVHIQETLKKKHVVVLGSGGIGNLISVGLVTAGIGKLTLVDADVIELSNLSRQYMFTEADIGKSKVDVLKEQLTLRSQEVEINTLKQFLNEDNIVNLPKSDLIVVSADSYNILKITTLFSAKYNIPNINIGYIEDIACWGPLFIPNKTGCFFCQNNIVNNEFLSLELQHSISTINGRGYQAPSNGPLNMLASSCGLLDIIKFLGNFGKKIISVNQRVGIWTHNFKMQKQDCSKNNHCQVCTF